EQLVEVNRARTRLDPEFELVDTGIFDDRRYWEVTVEYAKASPEDILARISVRNVAPAAATIDVLPTLWFRNTWSWEAGAPRPAIRLDAAALVAEHAEVGTRMLSFGGV